VRPVKSEETLLRWADVALIRAKEARDGRPRHIDDERALDAALDVKVGTAR
jgi:hypothetical protein